MAHIREYPPPDLGIVPLMYINLSKHGEKVRHEERRDFLLTPFFTLFFSPEHQRNVFYTGKSTFHSQTIDSEMTMKINTWCGHAKTYKL